MRLTVMLRCAAVSVALCGTPVRADDNAWRDAMAEGAHAARRDDHAAAAVHYGKAVGAAEGFGPADARLAAALYGRGRARRAVHEYRLAEQDYLRVLAAVDTTPVPNVSHAEVLDALGDVYRMLGLYKASETYHTRALHLLEQTHGAVHPLVAQALSNNLASLYRVQGRFDEAEAAYVRAVAILEKSVAADDRRLGLAQIDLAEWHYERNRYAEAEALYRRGIPVVQKLLPPAHPRVLELLQDWGRVLQLQGRYAEAEATFRTMLRLAEQHHGKDHPLVAVALTNLAGVFAVQGREAEAKAARARAQELAELPFRSYPQVPALGAPVRKSAPVVYAPVASMPMPQPEPQVASASQTLRAPPPPTIRSLLFPRRR